MTNDLHSADVGEIALALAKAQASMDKAVKSTKGHHNKYADLSTCIDATREALTANDIAVFQTCQNIEDKKYLVCYLLHKSGQWLRGFFELNPTKNDPQALGSAITYMRRYSLAAMTGLAQEDDDGSQASQAQARTQTKTQKQSRPDKKPDEDLVTQEDAHTLHKRVGALKFTQEQTNLLIASVTQGLVPASWTELTNAQARAFYSRASAIADRRADPSDYGIKDDLFFAEQGAVV